MHEEAGWVGGSKWWGKSTIVREQKLWNMGGSDQNNMKTGVPKRRSTGGGKGK